MIFGASPRGRRRRRVARGSAPAPGRGRAARGSGPRRSRRPARASFAPQEAVVDEDAGELVADRPVHEQRRDRGVDAAGEAAEHALAADLRADALDLLLDDGGGRPRGRRAGDLVEEVLQQLLAVRRVHDLRVELHAVERGARDPRTRRSACSASRRVTRAPAGGASTESRWLIQTVCSAGRPAKSAPSLRAELRLAELRDAGAARPRRRGRAPSAACRSRCRASGRRARRAPGSTRGAPSRVDRRGPAGEHERERVPAPHLLGGDVVARRAPSRRAPRARAARSAGCTGRRGRATSTGRSRPSGAFGAGSGMTRAVQPRR